MRSGPVRSFYRRPRSTTVSMRFDTKTRIFRFKRLNVHEEYNAKLAFYGGWLRDIGANTVFGVLGSLGADE